MPAKVRDVRRMLVGKLQADENEDGKHTKFRIAHEGKLLATTAMSRSYDEIDNSLLSAICKDLHVSKEQMSLLLNCPWSREDYVQHILGEPTA